MRPFDENACIVFNLNRLITANWIFTQTWNESGISFRVYKYRAIEDDIDEIASVA